MTSLDYIEKILLVVDGRVGARSWAILVVGLCVGWAGGEASQKLTAKRTHNMSDSLSYTEIITAVILLLLFHHN